MAIRWRLTKRSSCGPVSRSRSWKRHRQARRRKRTRPGRPQSHDLASLHPAADLRLGHLDRHHDRGRVAMVNLPIAQYPDITPPQVSVTPLIRGRMPRSWRRPVAAPIEQQVNGADNMIYMDSTASSTGQYDADGVFRDRHRSITRPGGRPKPGEPGAAVLAGLGAGHRRLGGKTLEDLHDDHRDVFARTALRRALREQLHRTSTCSTRSSAFRAPTMAAIFGVAGSAPCASGSSPTAWRP